MLQKVRLGFGALDELDEGRIGIVLRQHLQRIASDLFDRPGEATKRKVTIEFLVTPNLDPDTLQLRSATIEIECKSRAPVHRTRPYEMGVDQNGFVFNRDAPDSIDQHTLGFDSDEEGGAE